MYDNSDVANMKPLSLSRRSKSALPYKPTPQFAFTLIELLAAFAIIAILAAILIPVISAAKKRAGLATCTQNLRNCYSAINLYTIDHDGYYPSVSVSLDGNTPAYWAYAVAPYLGAKTTDYKGMMEVVSNMNCPVHGEVIAARLNNDSLESFRNYGMTFSLGPSSLVRDYRKTNFVTHPSQTMLLTEAGLPGNGSTSVQNDKMMLIDSARNENGEYVGGVHDGANNIIWADGHVSLFYDVQKLTTGEYNYWQPKDAWAGGGRAAP